jgi:hypothetical protein
MPTVLALGLDPAQMDLSEFPQLTPALVQSFIDAQLERMRQAGYEVHNCLVDLGTTAAAVTETQLRARSYDCVMIGAGLRDVKQLLLFEKLLNLVHELAPTAKICFNTSPKDSLEAVLRWV